MICGKFEDKLDKPPKYQYVETGMGTWKSYEFENGAKFNEFTSHSRFGDLPLISIASGIDPETGKLAVARGVVAVGQRSQGVVAIGQFVNGYLAIGQFVTARIAGIGQFCVAPLAIGQFSIAVAAIAQVGIVGTGIMQMGVSVFGSIGQSVLNLIQFWT